MALLTILSEDFIKFEYVCREAGLTRVNVSVAVTEASGNGISTTALPTSFIAELHDLVCDFCTLTDLVQHHMQSKPVTEALSGTFGCHQHQQCHMYDMRPTPSCSICTALMSMHAMCTYAPRTVRSPDYLQGALDYLQSSVYMQWSCQCCQASTHAMLVALLC